MDVNLPNFESAAYRSMAPTWRYLDDLYQGSGAWIDRSPTGTVKPNAKAKAYLPQFTNESEDDYHARLTRTPFATRFADAIRDFVGLILHNGIRFSDESHPILEHWGNLDRQGNSGIVLLSQMALAVMRRGHTFALLDVPKLPDSPIDQLTAKQIRPYWVHLHAHQVKSWRSVVRNGVEVLDRAVIEQCRIVPDGAFGEREETSYLLLTPGRYDTYTIVQVDTNAGKKPQAVHHPDRSGQYGVVRSGRIEPLSDIPLVCFYGGTRTGFFTSTPPLKSLADLNVTHYQLYSDHLSKIHYCCFPVAVRIGAMADEEELILGPGALVDAPPGGSFLWVEPNSSSVVVSRQELEAIEIAMDFLGVQYLIKPSDRQAAMVSLIQAAKVESSLELFARSFEQGINQALAVHSAYLGVAPLTATLDTKFFNQNSSDPNLLNGYLALFERLATLPDQLRASLLQLLTRRGFVPEDFDLGTLASVPTFEADKNGRREPNYAS